MLPNTHYYLV